MLKERWRKLLLREKIMFISGVAIILSVPLLLVNYYFMAISMTSFVLSVFYNFYKLLQVADVTYSSSIETDIKRDSKDFEEETVSSSIGTLAVRIAVLIGIPMIIAILIYLWIIAI